MEKKDSNAPPHHWLTGQEYEQRVLSFTPAPSSYTSLYRQKIHQQRIVINNVCHLYCLYIQAHNNLSINYSIYENRWEDVCFL